MRRELTRFRRAADRLGIRLSANRQPHLIFDGATRRLLSAVLRNLSRNLSKDAAHAPHNKQLAAINPMERHRFIAAWLYAVNKPHPQRDRVAHVLAAHSINAVRQWAVMWLKRVPQTSLAQRLDAIRPFVAGIHFGVQEIAWMARRAAPQLPTCRQRWHCSNLGSPLRTPTCAVSLPNRPNRAACGATTRNLVVGPAEFIPARRAPATTDWATVGTAMFGLSASASHGPA